MRHPGINGEGELRGQPANPGSPGKTAVKTVCVCVCFKDIKLQTPKNHGCKFTNAKYQLITGTYTVSKSAATAETK